MMNTPPPLPIASGWPMRLACLGLALAPFSSAFAVDGTITITGEIISSTCKINGEAPPHNLLINLPKIGASALKNQGDVAGATPFTLTLTECPSELSGQVRAHFEPGPTTDYATGNLYAYSNSSGTAKTKESSIPAGQAGMAKFQNVEIQLANPDGTAIKIGATDSLSQGAELKNGSSGDGKKTATLHYLARYYRNNTMSITPGKLYTYVQYSIVYP
ncbi:fimbrial subunit [Bordetella trematum]|uniref:Fimbrial subunit n=1 Tax=Bordetella trematum TaxID=123899 RepID=A0A157QEW2_9BORD|nr:fimbrial protein [Bordetella trematum]SAI44402.1 fimbrial subunit [Bordetella trematum]SAI67515.1 fimbrial subunit [Bordetella trematum]SUV96109.1 fimbrial subunit [Bordetella trematum]